MHSTTSESDFARELRELLTEHGWRQDSIDFLAAKSEAEIAANLGPRFLARLRRELRLAACQQPPREETP